MTRKKNSRMRGKTTHGRGSMKKGRGAGLRGGRGNAGTGKRGDAKKPSIWKNKNYFGKHGFKNKNPRIVKSVNIAFIDNHIDNFLKLPFAKQEKDVIMIDLTMSGCNKLLGSGRIKRKYHIKVEQASTRAVEKVKAAGGKIELPVVEETPAKETPVEEKKAKEEEGA